MYPLLRRQAQRQTVLIDSDSVLVRMYLSKIRFGIRQQAEVARWNWTDQAAVAVDDITLKVAHINSMCLQCMV